MNKKIIHYFEVAAKSSIKRRDNRSFFIGAVGIRSDGAIVKSINSAVMERPPTPDRPINNKWAHAEYKLSRKLDSNSVVYVARIGLNNFTFSMARPCHTCREFLKAKRVKKVYYTINENQYGVWYPDTDSDRIYQIRK